MKVTIVLPFLAVALLILFFVPAPVQGGGLNPPEPWSEDAVARFLALYPEARQAVNQRYTGFDITYDAGKDGLFGKLLILKDFSILNREHLEQAATLFTYDGPRMHLKNIEVQIYSSGEKRSYKKKDFRWIEWTERDNGVVTLDGTESRAMIPGLRVGDRVRVLKEYKLQGRYGFGLKRPIELSVF